MNRKTLPALIMLNAVLLLAVVVLSLTPRQAEAQGFGGRTYMMVAGEVIGRNDRDIVYIFELTNGAVMALMFDGANRDLQLVARPYNMAADLGR